MQAEANGLRVGGSVRLVSESETGVVIHDGQEFRVISRAEAVERGMIHPPPVESWDGVRAGMPAHEYHAVDALSSTALKAWRAVPCAALATLDEEVDGGAVDIGTAVHSASEGLADPWIVAPCKTRCAKAFGEAVRPQPWSVVLTEPEAERATLALAALRSNPLAAGYLAGRREVSLFWTEGEQRCKARIDSAQTLADGQRLVIDLKTTGALRDTAWESREAFADAIGVLIRQRGWHMQAAWYARGARALGRDTAEQAVIVLVTTKAPYICECIHLDAAWMMRGEDALRSALERMRAHTSSPSGWLGPSAVDGRSTLISPTHPRW